MSARDEILARVRQALGSTGSGGAADVVRDYRLTGTRSAVERLDLLADRLVDYRALVRRCAAADLVSEVAAALTERGASRVVVPAGLDIAWPPGMEVIRDEGQLSPVDLDGCDGVVTAATVAVAETGTIVLDGSPDQGRRAITLVPDYHLCIVDAGQVVETVPEAVGMLRPERPLTWVSGPSATSDIELSRVEGVHGPRTLEVILVTA